MKEKKDMENLTHTLRSQGKRRIPSDVMGSYTGTYDDEEDMQPVQDADDQIRKSPCVARLSLHSVLAAP